MPITPHQTRHALKPPRNSFYLLLPPEKRHCHLNLWCLFKCLQMQAELWVPMKISFTANLPPFSPVIYIFYAWMYVSIQLRSRNCGVESIQERNERETNNTRMEAHRLQTMRQIHQQQASEELPFCMYWFTQWRLCVV